MVIISDTTLSESMVRAKARCAFFFLLLLVLFFESMINQVKIILFNGCTFCQLRVYNVMQVKNNTNQYDIKSNQLLLIVPKKRNNIAEVKNWSELKKSQYSN